MTKTEEDHFWKFISRISEEAQLRNGDNLEGKSKIDSKKKERDVPRRVADIQDDRSGVVSGLVGGAIGIFGGSILTYSSVASLRDEKFIMFYTTAALFGATVGFYALGPIIEHGLRSFRGYQERYQERRSSQRSGDVDY